MKAMVITRYGGPEVLELHEVPDPVHKAGRVLVYVEAAGVNFADLMSAQGAYPGTPEPPLTAGREFAGRRWDTGERVMGYTQHGAFAEQIVVPPELLWPVPEKWTAMEAAAFPVNYFTAYLAYWKAGLLGPAAIGAKVLIHAAAGGVGTAAVEIGSVLGAETFGTSSSNEKLERVKQLGLQHGINYLEHDYADQIAELTSGEGVDAVFEMLGGEHVAKSVGCLRFLGRVITYGWASGERAAFDPLILYEKQTSVHGLWLSPLSLHSEIMEPAWQQLSEWIAEGRLHPAVGHVLPLEKAPEAFGLLKDRQNFGKVVLEIRRP